MSSWNEKAAAQRWSSGPATTQGGRGSGVAATREGSGGGEGGVGGGAAREGLRERPAATVRGNER
jgi:hypothetical protein